MSSGRRKHDLERPFLLAAIAGLPAAQELFLEHHGALIYAMMRLKRCPLQKREDVFHDVVLKILENLHTLQVRENHSSSAWVAAIARNTTIDTLTAHRREVPDSISLEAVETPSRPDPDLHTLHDALLALPEQLRTPYVLRTLYGLTLHEIAMIEDVSISTVADRCKRAVAFVRRWFIERPISGPLPATGSARPPADEEDDEPDME